MIYKGVSKGDCRDDNKKRCGIYSYIVQTNEAKEEMVYEAGICLCRNPSVILSTNRERHRESSDSSLGYDVFTHHSKPITIRDTARFTHHFFAMSIARGYRKEISCCYNSLSLFVYAGISP